MRSIEAPPLIKPQPFSVGVFSCPIAPNSACLRALTTTLADFANRPIQSLRTTTHSLLPIILSD